MELLLDTHTFLWWLSGDARLSEPARKAIENTAVDIYVSAASAWEISTKYRIGKLDGAQLIARNLQKYVDSQGFVPLGISIDHAQRAGLLPGPHRDPFDRMLAAQAQTHGLLLVSNDTVFDSYGVERLW